MQKKITKEDEKINWNHDAKKIIAQIHGLNPKPGAYFEYKEEKIKIWKASHSEENGNAGMVINSSLQVACGTSSLIIEEIQRPGKKIQKSKEFLLGFSIPKGTQLN